MELTLTGTTITQDAKTLMFENDNLTEDINLTVDTTGYTYKLDIKMPRPNSGCEQLYNVIDFTAQSGGGYSVTVEATMFPFSGRYLCQVRGINGSVVYHSEVFAIWIELSVLPYNIWNPVPSEFWQVEDRIDEYNAHPPKPGTNGYWMLWDVDTHQYVESTIPLPSGVSAVTSVNGKVGTVVLTAEDVGALPSTTTIPTKTSDLTNDSGYITEYVFNQAVASDTWNISHNLNRYPSVTVVDSGGNCVVGDIQYVNANLLTVNFTSAFSGSAYLN